MVTISDLHFNPLYDPTLFSTLVASDASQWAGIFQTSQVQAPTGGGTDTNYPLLALTLADMQQHIGASPVVLFTGDLLGHYIPLLYCDAYNNFPPRTPCTPSATVAALIPPFIDKTFAFVAAQIRASVGNVPVIYVPGNIDTYSGALGPDSTFLADNAATVYSQLLNSVVNQQTFLSTFTTGGYYAAQPLGSQLLIIGLNSNLFVDGAPGSSDAPIELAWLNSQLASAQSAGQTVWILMHVPPGANSQALAAIAPGQMDVDNVSMNWDAGYQATFMQTLTQYGSVVTLMLAGHTHMDEFRLLPSGNVLEQLPGISPCFGNNPAYKVLTITQGAFTPTDYQSFVYNLPATPATPAPTQFQLLYKFSSTYSAPGALNTSLQQLYPQLLSNATQRGLYTNYYASGTTASNPKGLPWNPITPADWPIFSCTISQTDAPDYIQCVNTY